MKFSIVLLGFIELLFISSRVSAANLNEKLAAQWKRYEGAQSELLRSSPHSISRERWEDLLSLTGDLKWTPADRGQLALDQKSRIESARIHAIQSSLFDLNRLRNLPPARAETEIARFCAELPKGGMLHVHPTGTLKRDTIENLLNQENPEIDTEALLADSGSGLYQDEIRLLKSLGLKPTFLSLSADNKEHFIDLSFLPFGSHPFSRFQSVFSFINVVIQTDDNFSSVFDAFAQRVAAMGVSYVEFTLGAGPQYNSYLEARAQKIEAQTGVIVRFNRAFFRLRPQSELLDQAKALLAAPSPVIVGIDLLGDETHAPALESGQGEYVTILRAVNEGTSQLHRTMHAGELGDPRNPRDAILLGAERLGHGVRLIEDPVVLEYAAHKKTAVETNLVSNLRLRAIDDLQQHPFLKYLRLGLPVSLSTDDEGILNTDINQECRVAINTSDITYFEFKQLAINSIQSSFATKDVQTRLLARLEASIEAFEKNWVMPEDNSNYREKTTWHP